jgi:hypothetical protein
MWNKLKQWNWSGFTFCLIIALVGAITNRYNHNILHGIVLALTISVPVGLIFAFFGRHHDK